jgi:hypothetical protein
MCDADGNNKNFYLFQLNYVTSTRAARSFAMKISILYSLMEPFRKDLKYKYKEELPK